MLNVTLAIFNLIPIHPLDGGKIIVGFLPKDLAQEWDDIMSRYTPEQLGIDLKKYKNS